MVKPVQGDILIVDDYPLDNENNTLSWYSSIMDTLVGETGYSVWEIGDELPFSSRMFQLILNILNIFWFTAYNNTAASNDTYNAERRSLLNFVMGGGIYLLIQ